MAVNKIFLIGLPGSGKTTLGMELANHLNIQFYDLDQEIEKAEKQTIRSIFAEYGEAHFRQLEYDHLRKIIEAAEEFVLATGGGTPCFFDNMEVMNISGKTIFLNTSIQTIKQRLQQDSVRPLMQTNTLEELYKKRIKWYEQAQHTIETLEEAYELLGIAED